MGQLPPIKGVAANGEVALNPAIRRVEVELKYPIILSRHSRRYFSPLQKRPTVAVNKGPMPVVEIDVEPGADHAMIGRTDGPARSPSEPGA